MNIAAEHLACEAASRAIAVSVIVPVSNVERSLEECLDSICRQTLDDIEIIVVDDGSTDRSGQLAEGFAERDARVRVLHKPNGGYGSAINAGLDLATGRYVSIVESDDWIEPAMLARLYREGEESGALIVKGNFRKILPGGGTHTMSFSGLQPESGGIVDPASNLELMVYESSIWSALYHRSALSLHGIRMLETKGAAYQDVVWKFQTLTRLRPIKIVDEPVYNYRVLAAGSSSRRSDNVGAHFVNYSIIRKHLDEAGLWKEFRLAYFAHQFFDFVFHERRLSVDAAKSFRKLAAEVVSEAEQAGITPREVLRQLPGNRYFKRHVYPVLLRLDALRAHSSGRYARAAMRYASALVCRVTP